MQIEKKIIQESAHTLLNKSEDCLDLAKSQHELAATMHDGAAKQIANAKTQIAIAEQQHINADKVAAKGGQLDTFSQELQADALKVMGDTIVAQRGAPDAPSKQGS